MALNIAANQVLTTPVTSYFQGRALKAAEQKAAQDSQVLATNVELAKRGEQRAQESHDTQQQKDDIQIKAEQASQIYDGANQVIDQGENAKAYAEKTFPEFIPQLEKEAGMSWQAINNDDVVKLATGLRDHAAVKAHIAPDKPVEVSAGSTLVNPRTGKPLYTAPSKADSPSSYDEFALAQKDPAFAKFLKDRKGKGGIALTMPDGTELRLGDVDAVGDLSAPTRNTLQASIVKSTDALDRLNNIGNSFNPKFLQIPGRLKGAAIKGKDLLGMKLTKEEQGFLNEFSTFRSNAGENLNLLLNQLSGAAINEHEAERLKKQIPNEEDSPTEFMAKYKAAVKSSSRAIMRANWALKAGIGAKSVDQLSKMMPLDSIDQVYEDRVNEIWKEMGSTPETKAQAVEQAHREFGLAR